jgi:hypothetical protein
VLAPFLGFLYLTYMESLFNQNLVRLPKIFHSRHQQLFFTFVGDLKETSTIELSIKQRKHLTMSLVIQRMRFEIHGVRFLKKHVQKCISIQGGLKLETQKTINFGGKLSFILSLPFFFLNVSTCCYIYFHCSYLYNNYNYSRTLCLKRLSFSISYWGLIKFPLLPDTTGRGDTVGGEVRVTSQVTRIA